MNISDLSSAQLRKAASVKEQIENLQSELAQLLGDSTAPVKVDGRKKKRTMSASAKAKIAAAQRARWAKWKAAKK
jgi:hypothetical protein